MIPRRKKLVVKSHISDKQFKNQKDKLVSQAKKIASPSKGKTELEETRLYNSMVLGMQNYYQIATNVNLDCMKLNRAVMAIFTNRLGTNKRGRLRKQADNLRQRRQQDMVNLKCFGMLLARANLFSLLDISNTENQWQRCI